MLAITGYSQHRNSPVSLAVRDNEVEPKSFLVAVQAVFVAPFLRKLDQSHIRCPDQL